MADEEKKDKEWWEFGDPKRDPGKQKKGEGSPDQKKTAMIMLMKVLEGMRYAVMTHPGTVLKDPKALQALRKMSLDYPWAKGYGGQKYADVIDIAEKVFKGDEGALKQLPKTGYDLNKLVARYGQLFGKGGGQPPQGPKMESLDDDINAIF
jgi:hypothetical protein